MLIKVNAEGHKFTLPFPTAIVIWSLSFSDKWIRKYAKIDIPLNELKFILKQSQKELRKSKKLLNGTPLIDIKSADGDIVKIFL